MSYLRLLDVLLSSLKIILEKFLYSADIIFISDRYYYVERIHLLRSDVNSTLFLVASSLPN